MRMSLNVQGCNWRAIWPIRAGRRREAATQATQGAARGAEEMQALPAGGSNGSNGRAP